MTGRKLRELLPEQLAAGKDLETGDALLCEVAGVSVVEVRGRRYGAGAGDEVDGRSDGRGGDLWRGICQGTAFGGAGAADEGDGVLYA